jgi:hypothetical protein
MGEQASYILSLAVKSTFTSMNPSGPSSCVGDRGPNWDRTTVVTEININVETFFKAKDHMHLCFLDIP